MLSREKKAKTPFRVPGDGECSRGMERSIIMVIPYYMGHSGSEAVVSLMKAHMVNF